MIRSHLTEKTGRLLFLYLVFAFVLSCTFTAHSFATGRQAGAVSCSKDGKAAFACLQEEESAFLLPASWLLNAWML